MSSMSFLSRFRADGRLLGLLLILVCLWIGFDLASGGRFITPRNLFNLSVQTASVAVMACGMVLIIVTRHIDLSVGSMLGVIAMMMGVLQVDILPQLLELNHPATWVLTVVFGMLVGVIIGGLQGAIVGYLQVPAFIVTLGGLLVWRGAAWWVTQGRTVAPLDSNFILLGGGIQGSIGATWSWILGGAAVTAVFATMWLQRRRRMALHFPLNPWASDLLSATLKSALLIAIVLVVNAYKIPTRVAERMLESSGLPVTPENLDMAHGLPVPLLVVAVVAIVLTIVMTRTRFGRYVFATGGNPEAANLAGIDTRKLTVAVFAIMGLLCAISASIASARLQSAGNDLGTLDELRVIAAVVIGGTSLAGGVGTIYGALLGALIMQSLQSGMALLGIDTSLQSIVIGLVLVFAVYCDHVLKRYRSADE